MPVETGRTHGHRRRGIAQGRQLPRGRDPREEDAVRGHQAELVPRGRAPWPPPAARGARSPALQPPAPPRERARSTPRPGSPAATARLHENKREQANKK